MTFIEAKNLSKIYRSDSASFSALNQINLKINEGEFVAIVGPSGSGKTTLMNLLGLLDSPTNGQIFLEGKDVSRLNENQKAELRNQKIGFVFQTFNLLARTNVADNVLLPVIYSKDKNRAKERVSAILEKVGLANKTKNLSSQLSGGEQQRVAIARALINNPSIIFADEPTGNLDSQTGQEILKILRQLNKEGRTIVLVTHAKELTIFADRIITLSDGKTIAEKIQRTTRLH